MPLEFQQDTHFTRRAVAEHLGLFTNSAAYYAALDDIIPRVTRHLLIVGWSFDDRVTLRRDATDSDAHPSAGERSLTLAANNPDVRVDLCVWDAPSVFPADQHITSTFLRRANELPNFSVRRIPSHSAFSSRHEKYIIVDGALAFVGGMDISHNRWDEPDHRGHHAGRVNPDGQPYPPYHDTQLALTGPIVAELMQTAIDDDLVGADARRAAAPALWPPDLPVLATNTPVMIAHTRDSSGGALRQIEQTYVEMIRSAEHTIYIENQYFAGDAVTDAVLQQLEREDGPEVIIIISRELPDTLGRITMGLNSAQHLSILHARDRHDRLGVFNPIAPDDPAGAVKVHSKTMVIDDRYVTLGSANISDRSFHFDAESNATFDTGHAETATDASAAAPAATPVTDTLLAAHAGLTQNEWRDSVTAHGGSRLAALTTRARAWSGLIEDTSHRTAPPIPRELLERFDMDHAPPQESVLTRLVQADPTALLKRLARQWITVLLATIAVAAIVYLAQSDLDVDRVFDTIQQIRDSRPLLAAVLTVLAYWLSISLFVTIVVPIVFFATLHGSWWGIVYSTIGVFTGAAIYYALGRALYSNTWLNRFQAVKTAKKHLEKIKPYGTWAVAISRMVPSGPFLVVNLVTGMVGFHPSQFLIGSAIGLFPGIIAFSFFGDIIRSLFTDPSLANAAWFVLFVAAYSAFAKLILTLVRRISGWTRDTSE
ncbi:MAG: VTT domain-containing protein [Spirochaeta sp.]|jgi:phospholipase D1/2|nr:VTT domain-containing protein [Spirochaeta sp.]